MSKGKDIWEGYGADDAYFAVATYDKFRSSNLDADARVDFFESGRQHIEQVWTEIEKGFDVKLEPKRALDYGCGVGRLLLPMAERCTAVIGVDISQAMLDETQRNAAEKGLTNLTLQNAEDFSGATSDTYDFVHSYIVLQHIEPSSGYAIIGQMADRLEPGGFGMIHVTFTDPSPAFQRYRFQIYRDFPGLHRLMCLLRGIKGRLMPMYEYDQVKVLEILAANNCVHNFIRETDHGFLGGMIFFRKAADI